MVLQITWQFSLFYWSLLFVAYWNLRNVATYKANETSLLFTIAEAFCIFLLEYNGNQLQWHDAF